MHTPVCENRVPGSVVRNDDTNAVDIERELSPSSAFTSAYKMLSSS